MFFILGGNADIMSSIIKDMSYVVSAGSIQDALTSYELSLAQKHQFTSETVEDTWEHVDIASLHTINPLHIAITKNKHNFIELFLNLFPQEAIKPSLLLELLALKRSKLSVSLECRLISRLDFSSTTPTISLQNNYSKNIKNYLIDSYYSGKIIHADKCHDDTIVSMITQVINDGLSVQTRFKGRFIFFTYAILAGLHYSCKE